MKNKIKVLCISRQYYPSLGGMATFCTSIFSRINRDDFDVTLLVLGRNQKHLIWFFPYVLIYTIINARKYDVIMVGDLLLCMIGSVCKKISPQTKRIVAVHGLDITYPHPLYQWYLRRFAKGSFESYVCNSDATKQLLHNIGIDNSITVALGVDKNRYDKIVRNKQEFLREYGFEKDKYILLTTGRLVKRKGVSWFLANVFHTLSKDIVYFIVGKGPELTHIQNIIEKLDGKERIRLITEASDKVVDQCYCNSDIFIMPNIHIENDMEGFGLVAIEASLAGSIVIASNVDGISMAIQHDKNGFLVEGGNAVEFSNKIREVLNLEDYRQLGQRFSEFTKSHYDWGIVVKQYENIIKKVCAKKG